MVHPRVPDEAGRDVALAEPLLLERKQAQHEVREPSQLADPPTAPRPDLRRDEVDDARPRPAHDLADREVRRRRVDRDVGDDPVGLAPAPDPLDLPAHRGDASERVEPHRSVLRGGLDQARPGLGHPRPAPGVDPQIGHLGAERGDHRRGVRVAARLERREEHARMSLGWSLAVRHPSPAPALTA
jgi:hypothetical protein